MEVNYDESDEEMLKFLNENEDIFMDFDFLPEIAAVNVESSLINETDTETIESSPNFEPSGSNFEQQKLWERQMDELSLIIANYDPTKPAPPLLNVRC